MTPSGTLSSYTLSGKGWNKGMSKLVEKTREDEEPMRITFAGNA
jgi:hypothetical protein